MPKHLLLLLSIVVLASCGSSKRTVSSKKNNVSKAERIVINAQRFSGTPYAFGGTSRSGMDCSGLIYTAFLEEEIQLPRVSRDMAKRGTPIPLKSVKSGDLLFFRTNKSSKQINHVGLVTQMRDGLIYFIHSTSSKGVITSDLNQSYWKKAFVQARRVI